MFTGRGHDPVLDMPGDREHLKRQNRKRPSTVASRAGGSPRSSDEGPIIGLERRRRLIWEVFCEQPADGWEESSERAEVGRQAVCDLKAVGGGSVQESEGESGRSRGG